MNKQRFFKPYYILTVVAGAGVILFSLFRLPLHALDWNLLFLAIATAAVAARLIVKIPNSNGDVTIADSLIFLTMLLYDGEAAVLLAVVDGLSSSLYVSKKLRVCVFNVCQMASATFVTVWTLRLFFGPIPALTHANYSIFTLGAICVMATVQYVSNSGMVTIYTALKTDQPFFETWRKHYLWTSISYFAGASAASIAVHLLGGLTVYAMLIIAPIVLIVYFTYRTYLRTVQVSSEKAEEAKRHADELSRYVEEQERIREQFGQIEKMSALGELASGVAHDFNNTLAGILGRAQLMLRKADDPETRRGLEIIIKAATDGAGTVKRIQDFARQRRDHDFEPVLVGHLLVDVKEITRPRWKDRAQANNVHINLSLHINTSELIMGDPSELREVLVNMVFNAVDAMPEGGRLTLSAEEINGAIEIAVKDSGIGMSPEIRSRIFDPFFTTKGNAGMGLGLAVCYGIIKRHEGTVVVDSEQGKGSTFRIRLPITAAKPETRTTQETSVRLKLVPNSKSATILVVDDEPSVRELLAEMLKSEGYDVTMAENGNRGLELFDTNRFKAVFTDLGMPGMSGWELAHAIRDRDQQIPLAVITGWGEAVSSSEKEKAKVDWVVAKPFSFDQISEIAAEVAHRTGLNASSLPIAATGT